MHPSLRDFMLVQRLISSNGCIVGAQRQLLSHHVCVPPGIARRYIIWLHIMGANGGNDALKLRHKIC